MLRGLVVGGLFASAVALVAFSQVHEAAPRYHRVAVAPTKTSIYVGSVTMTMADFVRANGRYESIYRAKVFPYFFSNESGRLLIDISDAQLDTLRRGEPIEFTGRGIREDGANRPVEGKATPDDANSGKLKVRVFVSKRVQLIFNTTYRFLPP